MRPCFGISLLGALALICAASALPTARPAPGGADLFAHEQRGTAAPLSRASPPAKANVVMKTPPLMTTAHFRRLDASSGSGEMGSGSGSGEMMSGSGEMGSGSGEMGSGSGSGDVMSGSGWAGYEEADSSPPPAAISSPPPSMSPSPSPTSSPPPPGKGTGKGGGDDSSPPPPVTYEPVGDEAIIVQVIFTIDGDLSDVTDATKMGIATAFAGFADTTIDKVFVDAAAGSVIIVVSIVVDSADDATTLTNNVATQLSSVSELVALLEAAGLTDITVESGATASITVGVPAEPQFSTGGGDGAPIGAIVGGVVGGVVLIGIIAVIAMKSGGAKGGASQSV